MKRTPAALERLLARMVTREEQVATVLAELLRERQSLRRRSVAGGPGQNQADVTGPLLAYRDSVAQLVRRREGELEAEIAAQASALGLARTERQAVQRLTERRRRSVQERLESAP
jgi:hypothetical protein